MDGDATLESQITALRQQNDRAKRALDPLAASDVRWKPVAHSIRNDSMKLERKLAEIDEARINGASIASCWSDLSKRRKVAGELFAESLAMVEGAWARKHGLDDGMCELADGLIGEVAGRTKIAWGLRTVPADAEFINSASRVVRIRFPTLGIWELPVAAHEFGHYAAERIETTPDSGYVRQTSTPVRTLLADVARNEAAWAIRQEYVADAFATYTVGPAYPYACVLLRFNPADAHDTGLGTHPADACRVHLMIYMLARMDAARVGSVRFGKRAAGLRAAWEAALTAAGQPPRLSEAEVSEPEELAGKLFDVFEQELPAAAYDGFHRAQGLAPALSTEDLRGLTTANARALTIADVLNAAWMCRIDAWDEGPVATNAIARRATSLCSQIIERRHAGVRGSP